MTLLILLWAAHENMPVPNEYPSWIENKCWSCFHTGVKLHALMANFLLWRAILKEKARDWWDYSDHYVMTSNVHAGSNNSGACTFISVFILVPVMGNWCCSTAGCGVRRNLMPLKKDPYSWYIVGYKILSDMVICWVRNLQLCLQTATAQLQPEDLPEASGPSHCYYAQCNLYMMF